VAVRDVAWAVAAAAAVGVSVTVSSSEMVAAAVERAVVENTVVENTVVENTVVESEAALAARLGAVAADKIRFLGPVGADLRLAAHDAGLWVDDIAVVADPAIEVLRWAREQALSETRHRHGDISARHAWPRADLRP
jgi:hypothetical protein